MGWVRELQEEERREGGEEGGGLVSAVRAQLDDVRLQYRGE